MQSYFPDAFLLLLLLLVSFGSQTVSYEVEII